MALVTRALVILLLTRGILYLVFCFTIYCTSKLSALCCQIYNTHSKLQFKLQTNSMYVPIHVRNGITFLCFIVITPGNEINTCAYMRKYFCYLRFI